MLYSDQDISYESPFLNLPLEIRNLVYKHAAGSCLSIEVKARNTLDFRISPLPIIYYKKRGVPDDQRPTAQRQNKHTLHNLMRTSKFMYEEVKAALYRFTPISVILGTAGPKQAFNIGSRPVNFVGTDYLEELATCRTVILRDGFRGNYIYQKPGQVIQEIDAFLTWWEQHPSGNQHASVIVPIGSQGMDYYNLPGLTPYERTSIDVSL